MNLVSQSAMLDVVTWLQQDLRHRLTATKLGFV
jgi:hypothetical protein